MLESLELWMITGFYFWTFLNQFSSASYKVFKNIIYFNEFRFFKDT